MRESDLPLELHFFKRLLQISFFGTLALVILEFIQSKTLLDQGVLIDLILFSTIVISHILFNKGLFNHSVILLSLMVIATMVFESVNSEDLKTGVSAVFLVVGLSNALLFKGKVKKLMHFITFASMIGSFSVVLAKQYPDNVEDFFSLLNTSATYILMYAIISYSSGILKKKYDAALVELYDKNRELVDANHEIQAQNEELAQSQCNLYELNMNLERLVEEKTQHIKRQNERLIQYSYNNAHYLRGPVARLQGLVHISRIDPKTDHHSLFDMIKKQAVEIDDVVKRINDELELEDKDDFLMSEKGDLTKSEESS